MSAVVVSSTACMRAYRGLFWGLKLELRRQGQHVDEVRKTMMTTSGSPAQ
jgi:hypothetical protein